MPKTMYKKIMQERIKLNETMPKPKDDTDASEYASDFPAFVVKKIGSKKLNGYKMSYLWDRNS